MKEGLEAALVEARRLRDANPHASLHCDTSKEQSAFDYGYRSACLRIIDAIELRLAMEKPR